MPTDDQQGYRSNDAQNLILRTLEESEGQAEVDELKTSTCKRVREIENEADAEPDLHFVPITGSDTPRSRSFNRTLNQCVGSGLVDREGEIVELTVTGRRELDQDG